MAGDPLSDIIDLTHAETTVSGGFTAGGAWAIRFPQMGKMKFFAVMKGHCRLSQDPERGPIEAQAGDVFLLSRQDSFILDSDPDIAPIDATRLFSSDAGGFPQLNDGDDCMLIGGFVRLDAASRALLSDVLPPLIHVRAGAPQAAVLRWLLNQFVSERETDLPGTRLATAHLAQLMFVQILRVHVETTARPVGGWLDGLASPRIAPALRLMHGDPGRSWTLEELAQAVAMSRSTFSDHFKAATGVAPLAYLTAWRMRLAERALREDNTPVAVLARSLGYTSESAFSNAFKRVTGKAPKRYRSSSRAQ